MKITPQKRTEKEKSEIPQKTPNPIITMAKPKPSIPKIEEKETKEARIYSRRALMVGGMRRGPEKRKWKAVREK